MLHGKGTYAIAIRDNETLVFYRPDNCFWIEVGMNSHSPCPYWRAIIEDLSREAAQPRMISKGNP